MKTKYSGKSQQSGDESLTDRLVRLDERRRQGYAVDPAAKDQARPQESAEELSDVRQLFDCIQLLQDRWPRRQDESGDGEEPAEVHVHPSLALATGQTTPRFGKFVIERELGRGGFGVVYLATDTVLGRQVALKIPRPELLFDDDARQRFLREAKAAAALDHPHVAPVYEAGEVGPWCYIASAVCPGATLAELLAKHRTPLPPRVAARLAERLSSALAYVHQQGILHRDLKPANVLLWPGAEPASDDELPFLPRLTDFGLAKVVEESLADTRSSLLLGTPLYMAPEQADGRLHDVGERTDVHALGAILYETLTGQPPFSGASVVNVIDQVRHAEPVSPRALNRDVPRDLEVVCQRCLQKRPEDRYPTAADLGDDLRRFLGGQEIMARPIGSVRRFYRWCQRPQRLREAGFMVTAVNLVQTGSMIGVVLMIALGLLPTPAAIGGVPPTVSALAFAFGVHVPMAFVGMAVIRQRSWAAWLSLAFGLAVIPAAIGSTLDVIPAWDDMPGFRAMFALLFAQFMAQTITSLIGLIALRDVKRSERRLNESLRL